MLQRKSKYFLVGGAAVILALGLLLFCLRMNAGPDPFAPSQILEEYQITVNGKEELVDKDSLLKNVDRFFTDARAISYFQSKFSLTSQVKLSPDEQYLWMVFGDENPYQELEAARGKTFDLSFDGDTFVLSDRAVIVEE